MKNPFIISDNATGNNPLTTIISEGLTETATAQFTAGINGERNMLGLGAVYRKLYIKYDGDIMPCSAGQLIITKLQENGDEIFEPQVINCDDLKNAPNNSIVIFDGTNTNGVFSFVVDTKIAFVNAVPTPPPTAGQFSVQINLFLADGFFFNITAFGATPAFDWTYEWFVNGFYQIPAEGQLTFIGATDESVVEHDNGAGFVRVKVTDSAGRVAFGYWAQSPALT